MILIVNTRKKEYPEGMTLLELIATMGPEMNDPRGVLCALNGTLVNPPYDYVLSEMDEIRIFPIPEGG